MRYAVSGRNVVAIPTTPTGAANGILGSATGLTPGRVFWLRGISWVGNGATDSPLSVFDCVHTTSATAQTPVLRLHNITSAWTPAHPNGVYSFPSPGLRFSTYPCAAIAWTSAAANGGAPTGDSYCGFGTVAAWGYEE